jgi:hypothetical protein
MGALQGPPALAYCGAQPVREQDVRHTLRL